MQSNTSFPQLFRVFGRIGLLSFGGPAAQIGLMHRSLVGEQKWLSEEQFLRALSFCLLLPGPEAMQLATYAGWRLRGIWGGLLGGLLFVLPGAMVIAGLALLYAEFGNRPETDVLLQGVKACVVVIVLQALLRLSLKTLTSQASFWLAALSFLLIFAFSLPFPVIIAGAAIWGVWGTKPTEQPALARPPTHPTRKRILLFWAVLWLLPLPVLVLTGQTLLFELAAFFAKLAVVTFGGAYAVLAYMAQDAVQHHGWLSTTQMVDALGLAETTPGPLILVTQFVAMLTGHSSGGIAGAVVAGAITLWMTFVPCFLWIFAGAPYVENLLHRPRLNNALSAITAAVVGIILNLSLWFALHVLFGTVTMAEFGLATLPVPTPASFRPETLVLIAFAGLLLGPLKRGVPLTLLCTAALSWTIGQF